MIEIAAKLRSALEGFWWALDEEERRLVVGFALWLAAVAAHAAARRLRDDEPELPAPIVLVLHPEQEVERGG